MLVKTTKQILPNFYSTVHCYVGLPVFYALHTSSTGCLIVMPVQRLAWKNLVFCFLIRNVFFIVATIWSVLSV